MIWIILVLVVILVGSGLLTRAIVKLERNEQVEKVWLNTWGIRFRRIPECPPWTRHYRWILDLGPREYRRKV